METLFSKYDLTLVLENQNSQLREHINNLAEDYVLNVSESDLTAHLVDKYSIEPITLGEPFIASSGEVDIDVSHDPMRGGYGDGRPIIVKGMQEFAHIGEEGLRSHFLVQLNGQYQGRATGETFNYDGKTDILIREGDRNVFIAECKIWKGEADLLKAVDQILAYLHWRDTKAALLVFNRNKGFSDVLSKIAIAIQRHPNCKRLIRTEGETEWRFLFSSKDDVNRELQLAVLAFDVPRCPK